MSSSVVQRIQVVQGDITELNVDAIVNAANSSLLGGSGVDGAIHRAAGPELLAECRELGGCPTGQARLTRGCALPARFVIHTVGPVYGEENGGEAELLRSCYVESLQVAAEHRVASLAFPSISTGMFGYPRPEACDIAVATVIEWLATHDWPQRVVFCCFDRETERLYAERLEG